MPDPQSTSRLTHWTVVLAAAEGEPSARETFAARYLPVVRAYLGARWRGRRELGELDDAVQEVFVDCLRDNGALTHVDNNHPSSFRAFLAGVARNVALRFEARGAKYRERVVDDGHPSEVADDNARVTRIFERAWAESIMREAADRMTAAAKAAGGDMVRRVELLRLRYHEDRALADVAADWGMPPKVVYRQMERARAEFHTILRRVVSEREGCEGAALDRCCAELFTQVG